MLIGHIGIAGPSPGTWELELARALRDGCGGMDESVHGCIVHGSPGGPLLNGHVIGTRIPGLSLVVGEVHGDSGRMDRPVRRVITRIGNVPGSNDLELLPGRSNCM